MFIYDDNFLTEDEIRDIEKLFWDKETHWFFRSSTQENDIYHAGVVDTKATDAPYFTASFDNNSQQHKDITNLINKFCAKHNIEYKSVGRIKLNIQPSRQDGTTLYPHIDTADPHLIFLYYVCDSDGDTILYNETFTGKDIEPPLSIMQSITPKRGAAFIVDGRHFHSITPPKDSMLRAVINSNLMQ